MSNIEFAFEYPWLLLAIIPAVIAVLLPFLLLPKRRRKSLKKIFPMVLHLVIVTLLVLALAGFRIARISDEQAMLLLIDLSDSAAEQQEAIYEQANAIMDAAKESETPIGAVLFGGSNAYAVKLESLIKDIPVFPVNADASNLSSAMEYAASLLPSDKAKRLVLLTDGKETDGDADQTARYLATQGVRIDSIYFDTTNVDTEEVQISKFSAPTGVYLEDELTLSAEIQSNFEGDVTLRYFDGDQEIANHEMHLTEGVNFADQKLIAEQAGTRLFRLVVETEKDTQEKNNEAFAYTDVAGGSSLLIIADTLENGEKIKTMLSTDHQIDVVTPASVPETIIELCGYDEVILSNVDNKKLPSGYDEILETYVASYGRSLLTFGGSETYMFGNMKDTAFERMLPVDFVLTEEQEGDSIAMMLVLDCSSSMSRQTLFLVVAKRGAINCVYTLSDNDTVGVISFHSYATVNQSLIPATDENKEAVKRMISALTTGSGTFYTDAFNKAHAELKTSDAKIRHVIFLSDGEPSDYQFAETVQKMADEGITITTIGLGFESGRLEDVAETGNGRYYYVSSASDLPDIMLSESKQVTVHSLITEPFTPIVAKESGLTKDLESVQLPTLQGYLGTTLKEDATAYLTTPDGNPIYAEWEYGLGKVGCFTSDMGGVWSERWAASPTGQLLTTRMVETTVDDAHHTSSLSAEIKQNGKTADITVRTLNPESGHTVSVTVSSAGSTKDYTISLSSPGVYSGVINLDKTGLYELMIRQNDGDQVIDHLEASLAASYSSEYNAFAESGEFLLSGLCSHSGGQITDSALELLSIEMPEIALIFDPTFLLCIIAMILLVSDIAIRKLRWKDIKLLFGHLSFKKR